MPTMTKSEKPRKAEPQPKKPSKSQAAELRRIAEKQKAKKAAERAGLLGTYRGAVLAAVQNESIDQDRLLDSMEQLGFSPDNFEQDCQQIAAWINQQFDDPSKYEKQIADLGEEERQAGMDLEAARQALRAAEERAALVRFRSANLPKRIVTTGRELRQNARLCGHGGEDCVTVRLPGEPRK